MGAAVVAACRGSRARGSAGRARGSEGTAVVGGGRVGGCAGGGADIRARGSEGGMMGGAGRLMEEVATGVLIISSFKMTNHFQ